MHDDFGCVNQFLGKLLNDLYIISQRTNKPLIIEDIREIAADQIKGYKITYVKSKIEKYNGKIETQTGFKTYLVSRQNDFLSSSGITRVALMIRAIATISHICSRGNKLSDSSNTMVKNIQM